ncbi:fructosamine kinase family protein [Aquimarina macrocephali]|uniref:fructosamine kinase family protein n=1 Tax=Aquimarina macrocephali TaxID=666563 RepID=UPI003F6761FB
MRSLKLTSHFEELLSEKIIAIQPLSGGDINDVCLIHTNQQKFVAKVNSASKFPGMFEAEAKGLQRLKDSNTFTIPGTIHFGEFDDIAFLILEYIDSGKQTDDFWEMFGEQLAALHRQNESYFGFENDNYIGSLPQYNTISDSAYEFYVTQRLQPQFELSRQKGFKFSDLDAFYKTIKDEIPDEKPSLIHGDLWNGNFMTDMQGYPCLIDPAVAYAPREMDMGMMHLFGGFNSRVFDVYNEVFPLVGNWKDRLSIWQLYYLLVHLNLFGSLYYNEVKSIVNRYS